MEIEKKDYSDESYGTARKAFRYIVQLPIALLAIVALIPSIAIVVAVAGIGALVAIAAMIGVVVVSVVVLAVPITLLYVAVALGPWEFEESGN